MHQLVVAGWLADAPYVAASGDLPLCCPGHMGQAVPVPVITQDS